MVGGIPDFMPKFSKIGEAGSKCKLIFETGTRDCIITSFGATNFYDLWDHAATLKLEGQIVVVHPERDGTPLVYPGEADGILVDKHERILGMAVAKFRFWQLCHMHPHFYHPQLVAAKDGRWTNADIISTKIGIKLHLRIQRGCKF
eukprot:Phypoly_transcript_20413.p1 GENE.Phypoly_transcript_20413~~Phypoly_transcript_20413.p1  ORF type:complete len:146 (+),score=16.44 Phypoly_transcript_20413:229-666(+)